MVETTAPTMSESSRGRDFGPGDAHGAWFSARLGCSMELFAAFVTATTTATTTTTAVSGVTDHGTVPACVCRS